jgi:hypothetical protein
MQVIKDFFFLQAHGSGNTELQIKEIGIHCSLATGLQMIDSNAVVFTRWTSTIL